MWLNYKGHLEKIYTDTFINLIGRNWQHTGLKKNTEEVGFALISFPDKGVFNNVFRGRRWGKGGTNSKEILETVQRITAMGGTKLLIRTCSKVIDKNTQLDVPNCNVAAPSVIIVMAKALSQIARLKHLTELPLKPHHESKWDLDSLHCHPGISLTNEMCYPHVAGVCCGTGLSLFDL